MLKPLILALLTVTTTPFVFSQNVDVSGLTLGMTFEQAQAKLGQGFRSKVLHGADPMYQEMILTRGAAQGDNTRDSYVLDAINGKIEMIVRVTRTAQGAMLGEEALKKQLLSKFGSPSYVNGQADLQWDYDPSGNVVKKPSSGDPCFLARAGGRPGPTMDNGLGVLIPYEWSSNCNVVLAARLDSRSDRLVESFTVFLIDERPYYLDAKRRQDATAAKNKAAHDAAEKRVTPF